MTSGESRTACSVCPIFCADHGEICRPGLDLEEALSHDKTFFAILSLGYTEIDRPKSLASALNQPIERAQNPYRWHPQPWELFYSPLV